MASSSSSSPEISAAYTVDTHDRFSYKHATHEEVLEDLSSRFILNLPDEELSSLERICFQVEQAHWFYEDFIREENPKFPSLPLKKFSEMLFHACPLLHQWSNDHEQAFNTFMQYKTRVPVCGAIMLNDTWEKCLLVKGWKASSGWGFPKGKINEDEPEPNCAIREVLEETGYNLAGQVNADDVIEMTIKEQKLSLYIVPGVPEDFPFKTKTRKEISKIEWFKLTDLPTWKKSKTPFGKFYLISPFIGPLKAFINARKPRSSPRKANNARNGQPAHRKDVSASPTPRSYGTDNAQESSSQSSSLDNVGPHTPSPHCLEPRPNTVIDARVTEDRSSDVIAMDNLDPHFARLLTSLTLSASALNDTNKSKPPLSIATHGPSPPEPTTPIPSSAITQSSTHSHLLPGSGDWSSPALVDRSSNVSPAPVTHSSSGIIQPRSELTSPRSFYSAAPSMSQYHNGTPSYDGLHLTQVRPSSVASSPTAVTYASPPHPHHSRRTSNTADISPYLSRAIEVPTSGKRLKQLALLECVADESSKMAPLLKNREEAQNKLLAVGAGQPSFVFGSTYNHQGNVTTDLRGTHLSGCASPPYDDSFRTWTHVHQRYVSPLREGTSVTSGPPTTAMNAARPATSIAGIYPPLSDSHYSPAPLHASLSSLQNPFQRLHHSYSASMRVNNSATLLSILNGNAPVIPSSVNSIGHR